MTSLFAARNRYLHTSFLFILLFACDTGEVSDETIAICGTGATTKYQTEYSKLMKTMHDDMNQVIIVKDDRINFLRQMIPHHQGAIEMAELIIQSTGDRRIINLARGIITEQRNEITIMNYLLCELEFEKSKNKQ